ncbi:MAG TPA: VOC family protein [Actinomycetota bacterium]|nr:VOC family protein [Actinomycetota bacterium]
MGEVTQYPPGHFCWIDLGSTDVEAAKAFYGRLLGWEFADVPGGDPSATYTMCLRGSLDVAGMHGHADEEGSSWTSYVSVDDAESVTAKAMELGGRVVVEPLDVPGASRMAVIADPAGTVVALWQSKGYSGARLVNEIGAWAWNELTTPDLDGAKAFYGELFGWTATDLAIGIPRASFSLGDRLIGGAHEPSEGEPTTPRWTISFLVEDADAGAAMVQELGGRVLMPVMEIPIGKFAVVADPSGAAFTINAVPGGAFRGLDGS